MLIRMYLKKWSLSWVELKKQLAQPFDFLTKETSLYNFATRFHRYWTDRKESRTMLHSTRQQNCNTKLGLWKTHTFAWLGLIFWARSSLLHNIHTFSKNWSLTGNIWPRPPISCERPLRKPFCVMGENHLSWDGCSCAIFVDPNGKTGTSYTTDEVQRTSTSSKENMSYLTNITHWWLHAFFNSCQIL